MLVSRITTLHSKIFHCILPGSGRPFGPLSNSNPLRREHKRIMSLQSSKRSRLDDQMHSTSPLPTSDDQNSKDHSIGAVTKTPGLIVADHFFRVPLDYSGKVDGDITLFVREVVAPSHSFSKLPYLLYLQGGPGFECPRPTEASGWIKSATTGQYRVILLDQRGTGKSSQISVRNLQKNRTAEQQAEYLQFFRADSIIRDAEVVRKHLVSSDNRGGRWTVLGQSFGGFCAFTYLSLAPQGISEVMTAGGIPPGITEPCSADTVYRACYKRVLVQNKKYYTRFPEDVALVQNIIKFLVNSPGQAVALPSGTLLTPRSFQLLGLSGMGSGGGFERLHFLLDSFFDSNGDISPIFMKAYESAMAWDTNLLYSLLHEPIYCQGAASRWSAQRIREQEFADTFDAVAAVNEGRPVMFTGEMVFPWMFDELAALRPYKAVADILAHKEDWPPLYNAEVLGQNTVPIAAITYLEDIYVDYNLAQETASYVANMRQWVTNEYRHTGIRDDGSRIFDRLLNMVTENILLD